MESDELDTRSLTSGTSLGPLVGAPPAEQHPDAAEFAADFIKKVFRIRGVRIERSDFLRQEFRKVYLDEVTIASAIQSTPLQAGVPPATLDSIGAASIAFETNKSAAMSFAAGLPGGFALGAAIPADITQYYVHAFRVMQKLAYLYGWQNFLNDLDEVDDETLAKLSLFLGVMMGVGGASAGLTKFAQTVVRPAIQKQITKQALTKTAWYGPMKQVLRLVGVKVTKDSFAKTVTKTVPLVGGVVSGGMTFVSLRLQSERLQLHLRELPPPGVDAAEHRAAMEVAGAHGVEVARTTALRDALNGAVAGSAAGASQVAAGAKTAASGAAEHARTLSRNVIARGRRKQQDSPETIQDGDDSSRVDRGNGLPEAEGRH